ncbi:shikimate dehydrogenase [Spirulina major CS-329]|nr:MULTISPECIES: shikimate dehydrogenase [Spirulina]MDB9493149.1 shikimate dehydrogenase [Spirulina subsalsa CS-330]MDB9502287.1 shikimate dehydrogenase [Spirulina major CS-329]
MTQFPATSMQHLNGKTQLLGVIGHPVEHSRSPVMHNAAIAALGQNLIYLPLPIAPDHLAIALPGLAAIGLRGFSVTLPHKQTIIPLLATITPVAQQIGAVNTVWRDGEAWHGTNTDAAGFIAPLQALNRDWSQVTPVILGNGGACRAVVAGCAELGCPAIHVVGRDPDKVAAFHASWQLTPLADHLQVYTWDSLPTLIPHTTLLINTTPVGMEPETERSPLDPALITQLPTGAIAYDLIYTPRPTQFLTLAQAHGATIIDGTEMLVQQGAIALQQWLGQPVPVDVMRSALLRSLSA